MGIGAFVHTSQEQEHKLDPRTKLLLFLVINIVMIGGNITGVQFYTRIILALIPFFLLIELKKYRTALIYAVAFLIATVGEGFIVPHTTGVVNLVFLILSGLISRFVPSFVMAYYMMHSTTVSEFVTGMERMRVTNKITIPISVMFRYFPTIAEENQAISDAMRMRGIGISGTIKNPMTLLEYKIVPIMMSTVRIGDELSAAALTKGLGGKGDRTNICQIELGIVDYMLIFVSIMAFI
jgi:energy-coupling factor transport system permease protein